jgi:hypothetical protein
MTCDEPRERSLKFYGTSDLATYYQAEEAARVLMEFTKAVKVTTLGEAVELDQAAKYVSHGVFPAAMSESEKASLAVIAKRVNAILGRFFSQLDDSDLAIMPVDVGFELHEDLLKLFAKFGLFARCSSFALMALFERLDVRLAEMLANPQLVALAPKEVKARIFASPRNCELILSAFLEKGSKKSVTIPAGVGATELRELLSSYIRSDDANPNYLALIAGARDEIKLGIDARLRLDAERAYKRRTEALFAGQEGVPSGVEVEVSNQQLEPARAEQDGLRVKYTFSRTWLEATLDYASILNNCIYVLEFTSSTMLLTDPSYQSQMGLSAILFGVPGKDEYPTGPTFHMKEKASLLKTLMYRNFLLSHDIQVEAVIAWFCREYMVEEFDVHGMSFVPSSDASSYLERCRHLFAELESVASQYQLYVQEGSIDRDLLYTISDQVSYTKMPSVLHSKYMYAVSESDVAGVLHALFSDQSHLCYINETLNDTAFWKLVITYSPKLDDFHGYQMPLIEALVDCGVLKEVDGKLHFVSAARLRVLKDLYESEAVNYGHYVNGEKEWLDLMIDRGWLRSGATLLTEAESSYFNYYLNRFQFSDGPNLRNRYVHGVQRDGDNENDHFTTYIRVLNLLLDLVIKINDDAFLSHKARGGSR